MVQRISTLKGAGAVFAVTWLVHSADHVRRGTDVTPDGVIWAGTIAAVLASIALTLIFTEHRLAPFAAAAVFSSLAIGVTASHFAPAWGYFSEPLLIDSATDAWAALAAAPEVLASAWLGWRGFSTVRADRFQLAPVKPTASTNLSLPQRK